MSGSGLKSLRDSVRRSSRAQLLLVLLLTAFVFQTSFLRGHIHVESAQGAVHELADATGGGSPGPIHNEADCPLWHASSICGAGLIAVAAMAVPPLSFASKAARDERTIFPERFAAAWRSRAPPIL